jgi:hypothetical protein
MYNSKKVFFAISILFILNEYIYATTIFSRQYKMQCSACHVGVPPMLNKTGQEFLKNGMRFSKNEKTTLEKFLSQDDNLVPIGFFIGGVSQNATLNLQTPKGEVQKKNNVINPVLTLFTSGSINKNLSTFAGARFSYVKSDPNDSDRDFTLLRSKAYIQYNKDENNIAKLGVLYIYPESSEMSTLSRNPEIYISPMDRVNLKPLYGIEYSYFINKNLTLMLAGGIIGESNNEKSFIAGLNYEIFNLNLGFILNNITDTKSNSEIVNYTSSELILAERLSLMIPLEYEFDFGFLNITGVYENNKKVENTDYYALETSLNIPIFENSSLRVIQTIDDRQEKAYAFKYAHILSDSIFLNANIAKVDTNIANFDTLSFNINLIY